MKPGMAGKTASKYLMLQEGVEKTGVTDQNTSIASTPDTQGFTPSTKGKAATEAMRFVTATAEQDPLLSCIMCPDCITESQHKIRLRLTRNKDSLFCPSCGWRSSD